MKRKKLKKLRIDRIIICLIIIALIIYAIVRLVSLVLAANKNKVADMTDLPTSTVNEIVEDNKYPVIKEDANSNYAGKRTRKSGRKRWIFYYFYNKWR